jgi:hypothetical protein
MRAELLLQAGARAGSGYGIADGFSAQRLVGKLSGEQPGLRS